MEKRTDWALIRLSRCIGVYTTIVLAAIHIYWGLATINLTYLG